MSRKGDIVYWLNDRDEVCFVNSEYDEFAGANAGVAVTSEAVLHRPLWDFITDPSTRQIYRDVLSRVRGGRAIQFSLRCDSPTCRRLLQMKVCKGEDRIIEFRVRTISEEDRVCQPLFDPGTTRSADLLSVCGWCKKVKVEDGWLEVEDAITHLQLFERSVLPGITHGICERCHHSMMDMLAT